MKARFHQTSLVVGLCLLVVLLGSLAVAAEEAEDYPGFQSVFFQDRRGPRPLPYAVATEDGGARGAIAPAVALGEPGLSYRYAETFGETEVPYLADTTHIDRPWGLFTDGSDNLYVVEEKGYRLLRYDAAGNNTLATGKPGVCYTDDYVFCTPQDVALDGSGNIWVADGHRVVQYDASGTFLQQQPAVDPWVSGNDNERFESVHGIAFDSGGRMYVGDTENQRIQVYSFSGATPVYSTTIGVTDVPGSDNGHFDSPYRLAVDHSDRLFVVDLGNDRVQRCTYAGNWDCSTLDSGLDDPQGITVDGSDNVYIADTNNRRIRKCSPGGVCTDFVTGSYELYDLSVDSSGNVYGSAAYEAIVVKYDSTGGWLGTFVGVEGVPYLTDDYHYNHPRVAIDDDGNIIIAEDAGHRLVKLDAAGVPQWSAGVPGVDAPDNQHFNYPQGVAAGSDGDIYVADGFCRVQVYSSDGVYLSTMGNGCGSGDYEFGSATGVAVGDNGNIYVSDGSNHRIQIYDSSHQFLGRIGVTGDCGSDNGHLCWPAGVDVDASGSVYVADVANCRVQKFDSSWVYQMTFGTTGSCGSSFSEVGPDDVAVGDQGRVYVSGWNDRVQVFDQDGSYLTTIGGVWGSYTAQFRSAAGVDVDTSGNVYVADFQNARIQKFVPGVPGWRQVNINGFGDRRNEQLPSLAVFDGQLYAGTWLWEGETESSEIWRTSDGTNWQQAGSGFGNGAAHMVAFDGYLYAGTWDGTIWRTSDGLAWTEVVSDGFGDGDNGVARFSVYNNTLYVGTWNGTAGAQIWRTTNGTDWTQFGADGLGDANNGGAISSEVFGGLLYVGTGNWATGAQLWRTDGAGWTPVETGGFGETANAVVSSLAAFDGYLYAGLWNEEGVQVWRSEDGLNWERVVDEGFGNPDTRWQTALEVYQGSLYLVAQNSTTGLEVWRTADGEKWEQVGFAGFGDSNNENSNWDSATTVFEGNLYIATTNWANGGEVWVMLHQVYLPVALRNY